MTSTSLPHYRFESNASFSLKFLWFCAGANIKVLERCQVEHNKYAMIGFTILLTSVLASLSGGYALWTVFNSTNIAISFGLFWGLMIGNLDRFLVSTTRKEENWSVEQSVFLGVRLLVAISIAFVVAKPLELKIFEKPIRAELVIQNSKAAELEQENLIKKYSEIPKLERDNQQLRKSLADREEQKRKDYYAVICEIDGTCGSTKKGHGPAFKEKQKQLDDTLKVYQEEKQKLEKIMNDNSERITKLTKKRDHELDVFVTEKAKADDMMTQLETLHELGKKNRFYAWSSFFITLIFVLIDVSPIIAKLFLSRGLYDHLLDEEEKIQLNLSLRYLGLGESHCLQQIEIQEKAQQEAINNALQSDNYRNAVDDLSKVYTTQLSREISRLGQEFNPAVYKHKIKEEMHKQMQNKTIPSIVEEEVRHHQKVNKVEEAYQHTLDAMNGYVTNHAPNKKRQDDANFK